MTKKNKNTLKMKKKRKIFERIHKKWNLDEKIKTKAGEPPNKVRGPSNNVKDDLIMSQYSLSF